MYVVYINLLYFLSIFLFTYNKNLLSPPPKKNNTIRIIRIYQMYMWLMLIQVYVLQYINLSINNVSIINIVRI